MIRQTYGNLKPELSRVAGTTGMRVTDDRMLVLANLAVQELMNEGAWPGVVDRWKIRAVDGKIVLPPELDMLLEFTVDGIPQTIMSPWAEFVNYGPAMAEDILPRSGSLVRTWWGMQSGNLYDRGELPVYTPIPVSDGSCGCADTPVGPWVIRQYASVTETDGIFSTIQGLDENGLTVRTQLTYGSNAGEWINGEQVQISNGSSFFETTKNFSVITAYTKPETNGYVRITAWNGTDEIELSNYAPWETTPSYHHYFSPRLQLLRCDADTCLRVVLARCRRRFVPVEEDTDVMIISNVLALKEMLIAQWKREAGALDEYSAHKLTAIDIMRKESIAYTGKVRIPALTFQRGFAIGTLPALR